MQPSARSSAPKRPRTGPKQTLDGYCTSRSGKPYVFGDASCKVAVRARPPSAVAAAEAEAHQNPRSFFVSFHFSLFAFAAILFSACTLCR